MSYRDVVSRRVLAWACTSVCARMPVAMAPLALVFLVRERPGGYVLGAALAAVYVIGEILGAPVLGMRLRPDRARIHMAAGLTAGTGGFAGLGVWPGAHPVVLGAFAFLAGAAPAAVTGGLRALLGELVPERAVAQALSLESMLNSAIWAVSPAAVTGLALGVAPRAPLVLAAVLMGASVAGLWLLPVGWSTGGAAGVEGAVAGGGGAGAESGAGVGGVAGGAGVGGAAGGAGVGGVAGGAGARGAAGGAGAGDVAGGAGAGGVAGVADALATGTAVDARLESVAEQPPFPADARRDGRPAGPPESLSRTLLGAWPVYVTGAASLSLLGLAELVLPALLEQRGIQVGWSGPLLAGLAVGGGLGAFLYGLRSWPGVLRTRSVVLMAGTSVCVTLIALLPHTAGIAAALAVGGMLQSGALLTRNLALREVLPPRALAAGYSVMYAAAGAGYAATGSLAGTLLNVAAPSTAILAGVALTLVLTAIGWWGDIRAPQPAEPPTSPPVPHPDPRPERAPIRGRCDS
ncbi:MFS transporter [Streptomyces sp. NPDC047072]|uniref:MFS transporter n=1 Tax=Streptomyces sp. NPDC047072 TaxID=3154809 RepID=UPI0034040BEE